MNRFFIVKTGWEMFDLSRAYGLGILVHALTRSDVFLRDVGAYFEITSSQVKKIDTNKLKEFLQPDLNWESLLTTTRGPIRLKIPQDVNDFFQKKGKVKNILNLYSKFKTPQISEERKRTLYGPMELRAIKGFRESIRIKKKYSEGSSYKVNESDWMLSFLGHLNITIWSRGRDELLIAMPTPTAKGTEIRDLCKEIRMCVNKIVRRIHRAGRMPTLAWIGINLVRERLELMGDEWEFHPEFSSILYGSMVGAAQQMKPATAGIFSLEYLNNIAKNPKARDILRLWDVIFRKTNKPGYEDLASCLSEYLANPSFINFEKYLKMHLRYFLGKEDKPHLYEKGMIEEVMKNVRS